MKQKKLLEPTEYEYRKVKRVNGKRVEIKEQRLLQRSRETVRKLVGLTSSLDKWLTTAYNHGVAAGMLKDKADHCYNEDLKAEYLERMGFYQNEFKQLVIAALQSEREG